MRFVVLGAAESGELVLRAAHNLSDEYLAKGVVTLSENPIDRAALDGHTIYIEDARTDPRVRYQAASRREGIVSGLSVPMSYRGDVVGAVEPLGKRVRNGKVETLWPVSARGKAY